MTREDHSPHPDAERLAEYAEGMLAHQERAAIERHLAHCGDCRSVVMRTMAFIRRESTSVTVSAGRRVLPFRTATPWARSAAAALTVAALLVIGIRVVRPNWFGGGPGAVRPELQELVAALANEPTRPVEGRLTGGFKYAPPPSPTRGTGDRQVSPDVRIAAAKIEKLARDRPSPEHEAALGVAYLALGDLDRAVTEMESAVQQRPTDGILQADLAAAYLARARDQNRAEDYAKALAASERSLRVRESAEARFNRALALERLHLADAARAAWTEFVERTPASEWTDEAKQHLAALATGPTARTPSVLATELGRAAERHDDALVEQLTARSPDIARRQLQQDVLARWAERWIAHDSAAAHELLTQAQAIARAVVKSGPDRFDADWVSTIAQSADPETTRYALAHRRFTHAQELFEAFRYDDSRLLYSAIEAEMRPSTPLRVAAVLQLAAINYSSHDYVTALRQLDSVFSASRSKGYRRLAAQAHQVAGLIHVNEGSYATGLDDFEQAANAFRDVGELDGFINARISLAQTLSLVGQISKAWPYFAEALDRIDDIRTNRRRQALLDAAGLAATDADLPEASVPFYQAYARVAEGGGVAGAAAEANLRLAQAFHRVGDDTHAVDAVRKARRWNAQANAVNAAFNAARIDAAEGEIIANSDPRRSIALSTNAVDYFTGANRLPELPRVYLARGRANARGGDRIRARTDFLEGLETLARLKASLKQGEQQASYADEFWSLVDAIVTQCVDDRDTDRAFGYSNRARAPGLSDDASPALDQPLLTPERLRQRVPSGSALLYYHVLPDRLLAWLVTPTASRFRSMPVTDIELTTRVRRFRAAIDAASDDCDPLAVDLYDLLLRPFDAELNGLQAVDVAPDGALHDLPFGALRDRAANRYLIERFALSIVPSATLFERHQVAPVPARPRLDALVVGVTDSRDITGDALPALPFVGDEITRIAAVYEHAEVLRDAVATKRAFLQSFGEHAIVHFGGHAIVNRDRPALSRLILSGVGEGSALFAEDIGSKTAARTEVVVLGSCESGTGSRSRSEGPMSLARPFLAAGVGAVVASLWPIEDRASSELYVALHEGIARGRGVEVSLRDAQLSMLRKENGRFVRQWAGVVVILGRGGSGGTHAAA